MENQTHINRKFFLGALIILILAIFGGYQLFKEKLTDYLPFPKLPRAELTVMVFDIKNNRPINGALVELRERVECPAMEGYPCPMGLTWQTKTDKSGIAFFDDQNLKEFTTKNLTEHSYFVLALTVSAEGYQGEGKEVLYSPNKELIKRDFGLSPPGDQRIIYNPKEKVFSVGLLRLGSQSPPGEVPGNKPLNGERDELILETDGYGYTVGDIVQTKTEQPTLGDVIVYDPFKNKSMCWAMGPSMALGKILGVPEETFSFQNGNLKIRTEIVEFDRDYSQESAVFGGQKYASLVGKNITLQTGEYLIDRWVGLECFAGELDETGSSIPYNRFTVNEEAITGIIVKKIGHDNQAEKEIRSRIY